MKEKIINVTGNGYCGSSAVTDYLRGFADIASVNEDLEFTILYDIDALDDLRHHLIENSIRFFSSDASIKRFRRYIRNICSPNSNWRRIYGDKMTEYTEEFLSHIVSLRWNGWWHFDVLNSRGLEKIVNFSLYPRINKVLRKLSLPLIPILPKREMFLSNVSEDEFFLCAREYISKLVDGINMCNKSYVLLDQAMPANRIPKYMRYFADEVKNIVVIRDPRDIYMLIKTVYKSGDAWIPFGDVESFINYFKIIYTDCPRVSSEEVLVIRFEDMVYNYRESSEKINNFLGLKNNQMTQKIFDPEISVENTQLFNKDRTFAADIKRIEDELSDWLYDFGRYSKKPSKKQYF